MRILLHLLCLPSIALAVLALAVQSHAAAPTIKIENGVHVRGLSPGGHAVLAAAGWTEAAWVPTLVHRAVIQNADSKGRLVYVPPEGTHARTIWFVVDYQSGLSAAASPPGFPLIEIPFEPLFLKKKKKKDEGYTGFEVPAELMYVLVVRQNVGAWALLAHNERTGDYRSGDPEVLGIAASDLKAVGSSPPFSGSMKSGDIVFLINPQPMTFMHGVLQ